MTRWLPAGFSWNCPVIQIQPNSIEIIQNRGALSSLGGGALSSISLPIERAPPLSNSLDTIFPHFFIFYSFIYFYSVSLYQFLLHFVVFPCSFFWL